MKKITESIYLFDSWYAGNITTIMVWVHWNELAWPKALDALISNLEISSWKVYCIYANPKALEISKRYYEKNMNRCFFDDISGDSYEENRVSEILPYLIKSDFLLDLHNTTNEFNSIPLLIWEEKKYSKYFDVGIMALGFDDVQPGWSDGYMYNSWKIWYCLETWNLTDQFSPSRAAKAIINFLKATKNIVWEPEVFQDKKYYRFDYMYFTKTKYFVLSEDFKDFQNISKWQEIWIDGEEKVFAPYDGVIIFAHNKFAPWEEWFCMWKEI